MDPDNTKRVLLRLLLSEYIIMTANNILHQVIKSCMYSDQCFICEVIIVIRGQHSPANTINNIYVVFMLQCHVPIMLEFMLECLV